MSKAAKEYFEALCATYQAMYEAKEITEEQYHQRLSEIAYRITGMK